MLTEVQIAILSAGVGVAAVILNQATKIYFENKGKHLGRKVINTVSLGIALVAGAAWSGFRISALPVCTDLPVFDCIDLVQGWGVELFAAVGGIFSFAKLAYDYVGKAIFERINFVPSM